MLSLTPGIFASALLTPSIFTQDTAAPGTIESSVRRSELPTVSAYPFSNGSATSRPYWSLRISHSTFFGF